VVALLQFLKHPMVRQVVIAALLAIVDALAPSGKKRKT
jgi:hypothetical protein